MPLCRNVDEFKKVVDAVVVVQKDTVSIFNMVKNTEKERVEKRVDEELKQLKLVINQKVKRQRYLWRGVGVLVLSLVCCLGYLCNELKDLTEKMEKMQVNIDTSMAEVKGTVLLSNQTKIGQQKDINDRRKNK